MTLDQFVKIQSIIDKRAIRSDTKEFLDTKSFSKSKQEWIRYGDIHFDHFISVCASGEISGSDDLLALVIDGFMKTLIKTGKMQKLTKDEFIKEITKNGKKHNYN